MPNALFRACLFGAPGTENLGYYEIPSQKGLIWGFLGGSFGVRFSCDMSCLLVNVMVTLVQCFDMMRAWYLCGINLCFSLPMSAAVLACRMITPDHCHHCTTLDILDASNLPHNFMFSYLSRNSFQQNPWNQLKFPRTIVLLPKPTRPAKSIQKGDSPFPSPIFSQHPNLFWLHYKPKKSKNKGCSTNIGN